MNVWCQEGIRKAAAMYIQQLRARAWLMTAVLAWDGHVSWAACMPFISPYKGQKGMYAAQHTGRGLKYAMWVGCVGCQARHMQSGANLALPLKHICSFSNTDGGQA